MIIKIQYESEEPKHLQSEFVCRNDAQITATLYDDDHWYGCDDRIVWPYGPLLGLFCQTEQNLWRLEGHIWCKGYPDAKPTSMRLYKEGETLATISNSITSPHSVALPPCRRHRYWSPPRHHQVIRGIGGEGGAAPILRTPVSINASLSFHRLSICKIEHGCGLNGIFIYVY
jgi:hypothetical protein